MALRFKRYVRPDGVATNDIGLSTEDFASVVAGKGGKTDHAYILKVTRGLGVRGGRSDIGEVPAELTNFGQDGYGKYRTGKPQYKNIKYLTDQRMFPIALNGRRDEVWSLVSTVAQEWWLGAFPGEPLPSHIRPPKASTKAEAASEPEPDDFRFDTDDEPQPQPDSEAHEDRGALFFKPVIYQPLNGRNPVILGLDEANETVWATQKQLADVFGVSVKTINEHWNNILIEGELEDGDSTIRKFRIVAEDGKLRNIDHGNLDMILAIGFRVSSKKGTEFRRWAYGVLKAHMRGAQPSNDMMTLQQQMTQLQEDVGHLMNRPQPPAFDQEALAASVTRGIVAAMWEMRRHDQPDVQPPPKETKSQESVSYQVSALAKALRRPVHGVTDFLKKRGAIQYPAGGGDFIATDWAIENGYMVHVDREIPIGNNGGFKAYPQARLTVKGWRWVIANIPAYEPDLFG